MSVARVLALGELAEQVTLGRHPAGQALDEVLDLVRRGWRRLVVRVAQRGDDALVRRPDVVQPEDHPARALRRLEVVGDAGERERDEVRQPRPAVAPRRRARSR